ncbi:MAG: hypothetical protein JRI64_02420 [Deltaproteobacteria bacterium]|nr:hypothetical protein [Deltaproteobacteria bacterium]
MLVLVGSILLSLSGCLSYRYERRVEGIEIKDPADAYPLGKTTIGNVLCRLGAPDEVHSLDNTDLLVYQRSLFQENGFSLGVPMLDMSAGGGVEISATGAVTRYDTLIFWFNSQGALQNIVFEKASGRSYLKTLFSKQND